MFWTLAFLGAALGQRIGDSADSVMMVRIATPVNNYGSDQSQHALMMLAANGGRGGGGPYNLHIEDGHGRMGGVHTNPIPNIQCTDRADCQNQACRLHCVEVAHDAHGTATIDLFGSQACKDVHKTCDDFEHALGERLEEMGDEIKDKVKDLMEGLKELKKDLTEKFGGKYAKKLDEYMDMTKRKLRKEQRKIAKKLKKCNETQTCREKKLEALKAKEGVIEAAIGEKKAAKKRAKDD